MKSYLYRFLPLIAISALLLTIYPFLSSQVIFTNNWSGSALRHLLVYLLTVFIIFLALKLSSIKNKNTAMMLIAIFTMAAGVGILESLSTILFFISSIAIGRLIGYFLFNEKESSLHTNFFIGLGLYVPIFSLATLIKVNYQEVYFLVLAAPIFFCLWKTNILSQTIYGYESIIEALESINFTNFTVLVAMAFYAASHSLFPTSMYDDHALHLTLWSDLSIHHIYNIDVTSQIWEAAPFTVDLFHAVISLLAGSDARAAFNVLIFLLTLINICILSGKITANLNDRILVTTLFCSTPLISNLVLGLQTDLTLGFFTISATLMLIRLSEVKKAVDLVSIAFLLSVIATIKLPAALIALAIFILCFVIFFKDKELRLALKPYTLVSVVLIAASVFAALLPYIKSYVLTQNPIFPLYNAIFKSPHYPEINFLDGRYNVGATFQSFFGLFYETPKHFESKNFIAGFQYFLLFPISIVLLLIAKRSFIALAIMFPIALYALPMFFTLQYLRYFYEIMPLASVALCVFFAYANRRTILKIVFSLFVILNLLFYPGASWIFNLSPLSMLKENAAQTYRQASAPEQLLNERINKINKNATVLFDLTRPYGATLAGKPIYNAWYSPLFSSEIAKWESPDFIKKFVADYHVDYIYWNQGIPADPKDTKRGYLREYLSMYGNPVMQEGIMLAFKTSDLRLNYDEIINISSFNKDEFNIAGLPTFNDDGSLTVSSTDIVNKTFEAANLKSLRYTADISCTSENDEFIAQINWDIGTPFYKLVSCSSVRATFSEAGLVPIEAKKGILIISARGASKATLHSIKIEAL